MNNQPSPKMTAIRSQAQSLRFALAAFFRRLAWRLDPEPVERLLFSQRARIAVQAEQWCACRNVPASPVNVITALHALGRLPLRLAQREPISPQSIEQTRAKIERVRVTIRETMKDLRSGTPLALLSFAVTYPAYQALAAHAYRLHPLPWELFRF